MKLFAVLLLIAGLLTPEQYEHRTEWRTNQAREAHDVDRLPHGRCVAKFAGAWADHLAATGGFEHQDLGRPRRWCHGTAVAEILLHGDIRPRRAVAEWLASDAHRAFLLGSRYDHMGAGAARDALGVWVVSIVFIEH